MFTEAQLHWLATHTAFRRLSMVELQAAFERAAAEAPFTIIVVAKDK